MEASVTEKAVGRANELYWSSDRSVNQIAEELDLSKGALYGIVEPLRAGLGCPLCGSEVVYSNRTARDRGRLDCATCDWDGSADETVELDAVANPPEPPQPRDAAVPMDRAGADDDAETLPVPVPSPSPSIDAARMRTMAGGALLGAAVGLALVIWARRR